MQNQVTVNADWLKENLDNPDVVILDASQDKNKKESLYSTIMIQGARLFDIKNVFSDTSVDLPNTLPDPFDFQRQARSLGIKKSSIIVAYDNMGIYSSPRVWWLFKIMGHNKVHILDGGLPAWIDMGYEIEESKVKEYELGDFESVFHPDLVKSIVYVQKNIEKQESLVIDARSKGRFDGTAPEPRAGLESGHIPNSVNIPYSEVLVDGSFKSIEELLSVFNDVVKSDEPIIYSCGSGITACILFAAAEISGIHNPMAVFDGSWTEWASTEGMPIEKER